MRNKYRLLLLLITSGIFVILACSHDPIPGPTVEIPVPPAPCDPDTVYFANYIQPLLTSHCAIPGCHDSQTPAVNIDLSDYKGIMSSKVQGKPIVIPGDPLKSDLYRVTKALDLIPMPPLYNYALKNAQKELIRLWILQGAKNNICTEDCPDPDTVSFSEHILPIIDLYCTGCHYGDYAFKGIELQYHFQIAEQALNDTLYYVLTGKQGVALMPPDVPLPQCKIDLVKRWIDDGAPKN